MTIQTHFPLGQQVDVTVKTYNSPTQIDANLADDPDLAIDVIDPAGNTSTVTVTDAEVTRISLGTYLYSFLPVMSGEYGLHPHSTGTLTTSGDVVFIVDPKYGAGEGLDDGPPAGADGLISVRVYRRITGDTDSGVSAIIEALDDALNYAQDECRRDFVYGQRTETLDIYRNATVYPRATPVASVSDPSTGLLRDGGIYLGGSARFWPDGLTPLPPQATVTYAGGYQPYGSGLDPEIPIKLVRVLCRIAYLALHPNSIIGQGVPVGAKSASVGDVSVTGDLSGFVVTDPSIERDLKRFERRKAVQLTRSW